MASLPRITNAIETNNLIPYNNFEHVIMLLNFLVGFTFMLRSREEHHELLWKYFAFSKVILGKYIGRYKIELVNLIDKTEKVTIKNPEKRDNKGYLSAMKCTDNLSTCAVLLL